jgi:hypothetical protein
MNKIEISKKLSKKENWTEELTYVHRSRMILGLFFGLILGFIIRGLF